MISAKPGKNGIPVKRNFENKIVDYML